MKEPQIGSAGRGAASDAGMRPARYDALVPSRREECP